MLGGLLLLIILSVVAMLWITRLSLTSPKIDAVLLRRLFAYHFLLSAVYYAYIAFNSSDSYAYYSKVVTGFRGDTWMSFYGTSTTFIEWVGYPFIHFLGFSYEAMMVLFSFFGFIGFVYFYLFFRETIQFKHKVFGLDLQTLIFFLPNLHFWSSSFGKGSIIFMGIGLFFYAITKIQNRVPHLIIGSLIIYHVRPHVMLVILVCSAISFVFSTKGLSTSWRFFFLVGAGISFFFIYRDVLTLVGIEEDEFISQGLNLSRRARELSKATSGVDISQYNLPMQVFTFLYRPLFIDAPGALGIVVSFENVFYIFVTLKLLTRVSGWRFIFFGDFLSKSAFLSFVTISIALAQVSGNLGLAMRQKSQVMILLMYVVLAYLDSEKLKKMKQHLSVTRMRKKKVNL